jgi:hypothetical protein
MTDTTTQTGVDEAVVVGNIARNETLERIAEAARKERDQELLDAGFEVVDTSGGTSPQEAEEEPAEDVVDEIDETPEVEEVIEPPAEKMIKVKVDGVEKEVPESLILDAGVRAVQKESAADKRLAEATQLLKTAQEAAAPKKTPLPDMDAVELANRIRMGSDEEAQAAISILLERNQATPDQIADVAEERVLKKLEFKDALTWFQTSYPEVVADPYLIQIAIAEEQRLRDAGDTRGYKDVYKDVGDAISKKMNEWRGGKPTVSTNTEKKERKSEISNLPAASARKVAQEQPQAKSPSQVIEDMRKARGQR